MKAIHFLTGALVVACWFGPVSAQEKDGPRIVGKILSVEIAIEKIDPGNLVVKVVGQVPTDGYTKPMLLRAVYAKPPEDGIQDYFLLATPPAGIAAQVVSKVNASDTWKEYDRGGTWVKGVRVHGVGSGAVVEMVTESRMGKVTFLQSHPQIGVVEETSQEFAIKGRPVQFRRQVVAQLPNIPGRQVRQSAIFQVHPTNAYFVSWMPRIFSLKNS